MLHPSKQCHSEHHQPEVKGACPDKSEEHGKGADEPDGEHPVPVYPWLADVAVGFLFLFHR
ncbi:MAG: hypothetical protein QOG10_1565 [Kribbellaceae bacterium]|nr:hypothetical protein [Kribbellaceae bacterium]